MSQRLCLRKIAGGHCEASGDHLSNGDVCVLAQTVLLSFFLLQDSKKPKDLDASDTYGRSICSQCPRFWLWQQNIQNPSKHETHIQETFKHIQTHSKTQSPEMPRASDLISAYFGHIFRILSLPVTSPAMVDVRPVEPTEFRQTEELIREDGDDFS